MSEEMKAVEIVNEPEDGKDEANTQKPLSYSLSEYGLSEKRPHAVQRVDEFHLARTDILSVRLDALILEQRKTNRLLAKLVTARTQALAKKAKKPAK